MNAEEIFLAAVELPSVTEQRSFISRACARNFELLAEVESLMQAHDQAGRFLERPLLNFSLPGSPPEDQGLLRDRSGMSLGRYEILRRLGMGGMGEVYLARDSQLQRDVGIKVLAHPRPDNPAWLQRFYREAKVASAVNHPNILTVYEIGHSDEIDFIVTEYIEGITLRDRLNRDIMPLPEVLETAIQTASALVAAHTANIVHRDLKPENIMIRADGLIKVLDFGLARHLDPADGSQFAPSPGGDHSENQISVPGSVMGTIHYMSPEQARGLPMDARSDLFSLGVVLYKLCTGKLPFQGAAVADVFSAIAKDEATPVREINPEVPAKFSRLIERLMNKSPANRPPDALNLVRLLEIIEVEEERRQLKNQQKAATEAVANEAKSSATSNRLEVPPLFKAMLLTSIILNFFMIGGIIVLVYLLLIR